MSEATPAAALATTTPDPLAERTRSKAPVTMGVSPTTLEEGWRLAQMIAAADEMVPKSYRGSPEKVLVAIQMGIEIGFAPMQALQSIAVIGGRPGLWGDGLLALVISSPVYQDHDEYFEVESTRTVVIDGKSVVERFMERRDWLTAADLTADTSAAVCTFLRRGKASPTTRRCSVAQARKAGYLAGPASKTGKEGPWQTHPDRMLQMRARSFAARDAFPDVLRGIRTAEELRDVPEAEAEPAAPPRVVRRLSEQPPAPSPMPPPLPEDRPQPPPPPTNIERLGPVGILKVDNLIGGPCAFLTDGTQVWLASAADATEIEKFIGTSHRLMFSVVPVEGCPQQRTAVSFAIAD